ncbi:YezD family protein [Sandaracinobacter sp. RS1-74]|uniref:YezD family protein n=1 Tax=Sandaracinobacteroides sayramensis TaxID=2913411 RepID=UPI001EDB9834|nr:YezD family protein [Sandaracinobacteroides sayramensis]MCG2839622.1 YezD family protein [Sandaracinobacteroides sayramensis]
MVNPAPKPVPGKPIDHALQLIAETLERLRFGELRLTVHEGRLVQIDVTERTRLTGN